MNFHNDAVEFCLQHNCANSAPVELIEAAMSHGAIRAVNNTLNQLTEVTNRLNKKRQDSKPEPSRRNIMYFL